MELTFNSGEIVCDKKKNIAYWYGLKLEQL